MIRTDGRQTPVNGSYDDREPAFDDHPDGDKRRGLLAIVIFFGLFLGWSMIAHLDAAALAPGQITVAGHLQSVQHKLGGVVTQLSVTDGQWVRQGQVLLELSPSEAYASTKAMSAELISLQATRARLLAEKAGRRQIDPPADFTQLRGADQREASQALRLQSAEMRARDQSLSSRQEVLRQRQAQLAAQIAGLGAQIAANDDQSRLIQDELNGTAALAEKGYVSLNRVRALQRTAASLVGTRSELTTSLARSKVEIKEIQAQLVGLMTEQQAAIAQELREIDAKINELQPRKAAMQTELDGTQIRSPASGRVVGLSVFTIGAVIAPGQKILDIVPDAAPLVITAQVLPKDAADLQIGQAAEVRLASLPRRGVPILNGQISNVSADSLIDAKTGAIYFTVEVIVPVTEARKLGSRTVARALKPGVTVEVLIPVRRRTAFQYLTEPLQQAFWRSFREP